MYLCYFDEKAYEDLENNIVKNKDHYFDNDDWVSEHFKGKNYFHRSRIEVNSVELQHLPANASESMKNENDLINVRLLYNAFKDLTPFQACSKELWSYLAHVQFKDYVHSRWMRNPGKRTIATRYFVNGSQGIFHNAISRLWWFGHITYQHDEKNPYKLTKVLLTNQQVCMDLIDEPYSFNREIVKGMLTGLKRFMDDYEIYRGITDIWRDCVQYINRKGAIVNLDALGADTLSDTVYDTLKKYHNKRQK